MPRRRVLRVPLASWCWRRAISSITDAGSNCAASASWRQARSLGKGLDNTGVSNITTAVAGPIGFFIGGGNTNVVPGTIANAKTRNDELFERPAQAETAPAGTPEPQVENREELP